MEKRIPTYKEYKNKINVATDIVFEGIRKDIDDIIEYAENSQGREELQSILDAVIADLKGLIRELE